MQTSLFARTPTLSVGDLVRHLKHMLEVDDLVHDVRVRGEISNFTRASSGHLYFSLKDAESAIRCVMWKYDAAALSRLPANGDSVQTHGHVGLYEVRGDLQLYVDEMAFDGVGALWQKYEALRARLEAEGFFAADRKRPVPAFPESVGIATSEKGAALQDMLRILKQRWPLAEVVLCPCQVQGVDAPVQIAAAIRTLGAEGTANVIIVARGGGSMEDLWAFNEEVVARAIYASPVCLITGIGHEVDFTIADFVADVRAPTPTAAAAQATPDRHELLRNIQQQRVRLWLAMDSQLTERDSGLRNTRHALRRLSPAADVERLRQQVDESARTMATAVEYLVSMLREQVQGKSRHLSALSPKAILQRGYALVRKDGEAVSRIRQVSSGDTVQVQVSDGLFSASVNRVETDFAIAHERGERTDEEPDAQAQASYV